MKVKVVGSQRATVCADERRCEVSERVQEVTYQGSKGKPVRSSFGTFACIRTASVRNVHWLLSYRGIGDHSKSMAMVLLISSVEGSKRS